MLICSISREREREKRRERPRKETGGKKERKKERRERQFRELNNWGPGPDRAVPHHVTMFILHSSIRTDQTGKLAVCISTDLKTETIYSF